MANQNPIFRIFGRDESAEAWASVQRNASTAIGRINGLLPGLGAALTAAGMVAFTKQAFDSADQLNKLSQRTGIAVEELSALKFAGEQADIGVETLALGVKKLSSNAFDAANGLEQSARVFRQIGVSATDADGKMRPTRDLLLDMAERFVKMNDGATKTALAVKIFGKSGDEMIPFLNMGREGINRLMVEAERLGLVMSTEAAQAAEKFNDNMAALGSVAQSLGIELVNRTAPGLARITEAMREALKESGVLMALWVGLGGVLGESLGLGMQEAAERARTLIRELGELARVQEQLKHTTLSPDALRRETDKITAQIEAKQAELRVLQQQVATERKQQEKNQEAGDFIAQREKDQKTADTFIAPLRKEAETYGLSKEEIVKYNAALESAKLQSVDIAIRLRREAGAWAEKIAAMQRAKDETAAMMKIDAEQKASKDGAINAIIREAEALQFEASRGQDTNEQRKVSQLLANLEAAGVDRESEAYINLAVMIDGAAARLAHYNELKTRAAAREGAFKSLQQEIAALQFETVTLRLNNEQRARAVALRNLSEAGVNALGDPKGAQLMADFEAAQAANRRERNALELEEKRSQLDQRTAMIFQSLQTEEEAEITSFLARTETIAQARAQGLINEQQYQIAREALEKDHQKKLTAFEDEEIRKRTGASRVHRKLDLDSAGYFFDQMSGLMQTKSRTMFEIGKGAAIVGAVIDTYKAATGAYASLASIPIVGPALGAAAAAAAVAVGMARVQAIRSTTMGGGGGAVGTFAANPSTGLPESPTSSGFEAPPSPIAQTAVAPARNVTITFVGSGRYTQEEIRDSLIPALNEAIGDGVVLAVK